MYRAYQVNSSTLITGTGEKGKGSNEYQFASKMFITHPRE